VYLLRFVLGDGRGVVGDGRRRIDRAWHAISTESRKVVPSPKIDDMICSVVFYDSRNCLASVKSHDLLCDESHCYRQVPIIDDKVRIPPRRSRRFRNSSQLLWIARTEYNVRRVCEQE